MPGTVDCLTSHAKSDSSEWKGFKLEMLEYVVSCVCDIFSAYDSLTSVASLWNSSVAE